MSLTTAIAIYAAVVASADVAWQVVSTALARRTRLTVAVVHVPSIPTITVTICNRSTHDVRVQSINLLWEHDGQWGGRMLFERSAPLFSDHPEGVGPMLRAMTELPDIIKPYDSDHATAGGERLREAMPLEATNIRAAVGTADGRLFVGEARTADELWGPKAQRFRRWA